VEQVSNGKELESFGKSSFILPLKSCLLTATLLSLIVISTDKKIIRLFVRQIGTDSSDNYSWGIFFFFRNLIT
jgi:hypothetical protein